MSFPICSCSAFRTHLPLCQLVPEKRQQAQAAEQSCKTRPHRTQRTARRKRPKRSPCPPLTSVEPCSSAFVPAVDRAPEAAAAGSVPVRRLGEVGRRRPAVPRRRRAAAPTCIMAQGTKHGQPRFDRRLGVATATRLFFRLFPSHVSPALLGDHSIRHYIWRLRHPSPRGRALRRALRDTVRALVSATQCRGKGRA